MLYRNRYYQNNWGKFLTRDPIGYRSQTNLYNIGFVINMVDPNGTQIIIDHPSPKESCTSFRREYFDTYVEVDWSSSTIILNGAYKMEILKQCYDQFHHSTTKEKDEKGKNKDKVEEHKCKPNCPAGMTVTDENYQDKYPTSKTTPSKNTCSFTKAKVCDSVTQKCREMPGGSVKIKIYKNYWKESQRIYTWSCKCKFFDDGPPPPVH
jgi:uncharacterized protein RhaS with RHS repeats